MNQNNYSARNRLNQERRTENPQNKGRQAYQNGRRRPDRNRRYAQQKKRKRLQILKKNIIPLALLAILAVGILYFAALGVRSVFEKKEEQIPGADAEIIKLDGEIDKMTIDTPKMDVNLLTVNKYSRPGTKLERVKGIVIHYVGNPGTTAAQNRSYFESLKDTHETSASSHFVIGMDGEILQCIPTSEIAYCSNERNADTVAIECCHAGKDGKFTDETYDSLVELTAFLCCKFDLEIEDIIRHYDITGKECPRYYVTHEEKWVQFKRDVAAYIEEHAHVSP